MSINKVIIDGNVKLDLSEDTVTEQTVSNNRTFHNSDGGQKNWFKWSRYTKT